MGAYHRRPMGIDEKRSLDVRGHGLAGKWQLVV